ncbi:hypothetical protein EDD22DRAFT_786704 [Suillus occidentalis]|nr:hypothetical protein EDD22DRAFT_786704 [Suillus occidentalis]
MIPDLEPPDNPLLNHSVNLRGGYVLLRACDRYNYHPSEAKSRVIGGFLDAPVPKFKHWVRLWLPNGQVAHCAWKETLKPVEKVRMARNVKVTINDRNEIAQVLYYAQLAIKIYRFVTVAMVSVYSRPDPELLQKLMQTVWLCKYHDEALQLVSVKSIQSVVAMISHCPKLQSGMVEDRFFLLEKPGLGLVTVDEEVEDEADGDE